MTQVRNGFRKFLEFPSLYTLFQTILGSKRARTELVKTFLNIEAGMAVLDVGCGPGDLFPYLPKGIRYVGFDFEQSYINQAKALFGQEAEFICDDVTKFNFENSSFDRVLICGVLHHLENEEIEILFQSLKKVLKPGGCIMCVENTFIPNQNPVAKFLISRDRGQNIRSPEGYLNLCRKYFQDSIYQIRHNLLRVPYTHVLITCSNPKD